MARWENEAPGTIPTAIGVKVGNIKIFVFVFRPLHPLLPRQLPLY